MQPLGSGPHIPAQVAPNFKLTPAPHTPLASATIDLQIPQPGAFRFACDVMPPVGIIFWLYDWSYVPPALLRNETLPAGLHFPPMVLQPKLPNWPLQPPPHGIDIVVDGELHYTPSIYTYTNEGIPPIGMILIRPAPPLIERPYSPFALAVSTPR